MMPCFGQHRGMRLARGDVLAIEAPVEVDRGVDLLHDRRRDPTAKRPPHILLLMMRFAAEVLPS